MLVSENIEGEMLSVDDYNSEPVYYCTKCLSLRVMAFEGEDYCDACGSTNINTTDIESWREMYKNKYGKEH